MNTRLDRELVARHDLYAFVVASRTAKLVVSDAGFTPVVTADGTAVFHRASGDINIIGKRNRVLMVMPPGGDARAITEPKQNVRRFKVDPASGTIAFIVGGDKDELWSAPLAGDGKPKQLGKADLLLAFPEPGVALILRDGKLVRQPLAGGKSTELAGVADSRVLGVHGNRLVLQDLTTKLLSTAPVTDPEKRIALALGPDQLGRRDHGDQPYVVVAREREHEVIDLADPGKPFLIARKARPEEAVKIGGRIAVLATIDTDDDGKYGAGDETDLCFVSPAPEPADFPVRSLPKRHVETAAKLAPLTEDGPFAGAQLRFITRGMTDFAKLTVAEGPTDPEELREIVRQMQARVTKLSGHAGLSLELLVRKGGLRALSSWEPDPGVFVTSAGIGMAQLQDRRELRVEVNAKVDIAQQFPDLPVGAATCSGTVKNLGDAELEGLEVECESRHYEKERRVKAKTSPAKLASNATGTYRISLGTIDGQSPVWIGLSSGGARVLYLDAFDHRKTEAVLAVARKVYEETGLAYWHVWQSTESRNRTRPVVNFTVHSSPAFEQGDDRLRRTTAANALALFAPLLKTRKDLSGEPVLLILRGKDDDLGWMYAGGRLTAAGPGP